VFLRGDLRLRPDYFANLSHTDEDLDGAWEKLEVGDFSALMAVNGVHNSLVGMGRDYNNEWMAEKFRIEFNTKQHIASCAKEGILGTFDRTWEFRHLYRPTWKEEDRRWPIYWKLLPPPKTWPIYRLNLGVQVNTGEKVVHTGIYLPSADRSCPEFMVMGSDAWKANIGEYSERSLQATLWTLVERVADSGGPIPGQEPWRKDRVIQDRVEGGEVCPRTGYWWSPADKSGTQLFKQGETFPIITSKEYGQSYWLWGGEEKKK
jgi:hypothetical protein